MCIITLCIIVINYIYILLKTYTKYLKKSRNKKLDAGYNLITKYPLV